MEKVLAGESAAHELAFFPGVASSHIVKFLKSGNNSAVEGWVFGKEASDFLMNNPYALGIEAFSVGWIGNEGSGEGFIEIVAHCFLLETDRIGYSRELCISPCHFEDDGIII